MGTYWPPIVIKFALAVSKAEGFGIPTAIPTLGNNPCDVTGADAGSFQTMGVMNIEGVVRFAKVEDGWTAAYIKFNRMLSGKSTVYPLTLTLAEVGNKYAGPGHPEWAENVASELGVPVTTTLGEIAEECQAT